MHWNFFVRLHAVTIATLGGSSQSHRDTCCRSSMSELWSPIPWHPHTFQCGTAWRRIQSIHRHSMPAICSRRHQILCRTQSEKSITACCTSLYSTLELSSSSTRPGQRLFLPFFHGSFVGIHFLIGFIEYIMGICMSGRVIHGHADCCGDFFPGLQLGFLQVSHLLLEHLYGIVAGSDILSLEDGSEFVRSNPENEGIGEKGFQQAA